MSAFIVVKYLHIISAILSIALFIFRFRMKIKNNPLAQNKALTIIPHINDTVLLLSGFALLVMFSINPFAEPSRWMLEKIIAAFVYVACGHIALSKRPHSEKKRKIMFLIGLVCLAAIGHLLFHKSAILLGYL